MCKLTQKDVISYTKAISTFLTSSICCRGTECAQQKQLSQEGWYDSLPCLGKKCKTNGRDLEEEAEGSFLLAQKDWGVEISCQGESCCFWVISHPVRVSWEGCPGEQRPFWFGVLRVRVMKQLAGLVMSPCHSQPELAEL